MKLIELIWEFLYPTFICSTNAITEKGELYNIDGNRSRLDPMIYGPKRVIFVTGINKIVKNSEEFGVRQYATPMYVKRLNESTPCTKLAYCVDCKSSVQVEFVTILL